MPCKAHDYCYDLTRVGLHRTVGTGNCDRTFRELLSAHCDNRADVWTLQCHSVAMRPKIGTQLAGVSPEPGRVRVRNVSTGKCLALSVPWSSTSAPPGAVPGRVPVVQKSCAAGDFDQQFYVVQAGAAGSGNYIMKPVSSSVGDAGLGAGNVCLATSSGTPDYDGSFRMFLEQATDCSTSRACSYWWRTRGSACYYKVTRYGTLARSSSGVYSCSPAGSPFTCRYTRNWVRSTTDEFFVSDIQARSGRGLVSPLMSTRYALYLIIVGRRIPGGM